MGEASSSRVTLNKDPLAEFYERAKVSLAEDVCSISILAQGQL
jgi:hypothetical protein